MAVEQAPFLAVELDAIRKSDPLARAARARGIAVSRNDVLGGLLDMWEDCWRRKSSRVTPTIVAGFFGADLTPELTEWEFLEPQEDAFRAKGSGKYLRIMEGRSRGGHAAKGNLRRGQAGGGAGPEAGDKPETSRSGCPPAASGSSSEQRTANSEILKPPPPAAVESVPEPEAFEPDSSGEFQPTAWGFWGWHNQERRARELYDEPTPPHGLERWHDKAIAKVGIDGLIRSYLAYLDDDAFALKHWPFPIFMSEQVWLPRANAPPRKPVRL